jgi:hypothetical protein
VDIPLESAVEEPAAISARKGSLPNREEILFKIECYLAAWGVADSQGQIVSELLGVIEARVDAEPQTNPFSIAIEEAERFIHDHCRDARAALGFPLHTERPLETNPMKMQTSLSRIPSFRLIAGWCLFVIIFVLVFLFTH